MSAVIEFLKPSRTPSTPRENGQSAQILFFTGVRYQRMPDVTPDKHSPSRDGGKRRRKRG